MDVEVKDGLTGEGAAVHHQPVAVGDFQFFGQLPGDDKEFPQEWGILHLGLGHADDVAVGDDEDMDGGLGAGVVEGGYLLVLVNDAGRSFSSDDATEDAGVHLTSQR